MYKEQKINQLFKKLFIIKTKNKHLQQKNNLIIQEFKKVYFLEEAHK